MPKRHYSTICSLDGFMTDADGNFDWAEPDEEVHSYFNDQERQFGTFLYGRRLYETMRYWESEPSEEEWSPVAREYAGVWRAAHKVVYSTTLADVDTARTRLEREFDPDAVAKLIADSSTDLSIGGAELAAVAMRAGLVDDVHVMVVPCLLGGGTPALPIGVSGALQLVEERRFAAGWVSLHYRVVR